jgi:hypothetical protein
MPQWAPSRNAAGSLMGDLPPSESLPGAAASRAGTFGQRVEAAPGHTAMLAPNLPLERVESVGVGGNARLRPVNPLTAPAGTPPAGGNRPA